jgi:dTMP kinase
MNANLKESSRGRFITVEGIDGAGKSTHLATVQAALQARGIDVVLTREPGGTPVGEALREVVLQQAMSPRTETLVMFAARAEHVEHVIEPALRAGRWLLCDRFTDATYAYQCGGRGLAEAQVAALEAWVHPQLQPDLTLLFDVDPAIAAQRLARARAADRFEGETQAFFARVRASYLARARAMPERIAVVATDAPPEEVRRRMLAVLEERLTRWQR